jgi:hypothetical protein
MNKSLRNIGNSRNDDVLLDNLRHFTVGAPSKPEIRENRAGYFIGIVEALGTVDEIEVSTSSELN